MNVGYHLLDAQVIAGRADDEAYPGASHARLLADSSALAGVLRALGVGPDGRVLVDLEDDADAVLVALAVSRIGAALVLGPADAGRLRALLDDTPLTTAVVDDPTALRTAVDRRATRPGTIVVRGGTDDLDERHELDWDVAMRAGRTDPAAVVDLPGSSPYLLDLRRERPLVRTVAEQVDLDLPARDVRAWRSLLLPDPG